MVLTDQLRIGTLLAAIVQANGTQVEGLLPVSIFKKVHVDHRGTNSFSFAEKLMSLFVR